MKKHNRFVAATAAAVLGLSAFSAVQASGVTIYGVIDEGLLFQTQKKTGEERDSTFKMLESGFSKMGSRFGLKGEEELSAGYKLSYVLENGFEPDSGELTTYEKTKDRIFGRESQMSLHTPYGTLAFGRMGNLNSANGTYSVTFKEASAFGPSFNQVAVMNFFAGSARYDNMVTYRSPKLFGTTTLFAQYSFETNKSEREHLPDRKRYAAVAGKVELGWGTIAAALDEVRYSNADNPGVKNTYTATLATNWDVGFGRFFLSGQWMKDVRQIAFGPNFAQADANFSTNTTGTEGITGYAVLTGFNVPAWGGMFKTGVNWLDAENDGLKSGEDCDLERWNAGVFYNYPLSKRTAVYGGISYGEQESQTSVKTEVKTAQCIMGLSHTF